MMTRTMRNVAALLGAVACLTVGAAPHQAVGAGNEPAVEILQQDVRSVTVAFTPAGWELERFSADGQEFVHIDFANAVFEDSVGRPRVPYHVAVFGIPEGAEVRHQVVRLETEAFEDVLLGPVPERKRVDKRWTHTYERDAAIYVSERPYPAQLVQVDAPAYLRDQQVVRVTVAGAQFIPTQQRLVKFQRVVVRFEFVGGVEPPTPDFARLQADEELYQLAVLNHEQARRWRRPPKRETLGKSGSVFSEGMFYKFPITEEGIYRITGKLLESHGINLSSIDPATLRLYNNGGRELPRFIDAPRPGDLLENAILVLYGGDGRFDPDDSILFYGRGVQGWVYDRRDGTFSHDLNRYVRGNIYWLTWGGGQSGKRMQTVSGTPTSSSVIETYQGLHFIEEEINYPLRSGPDWFGWQFANDDFSRSRTYEMSLPNAVESASLAVNARFVSLSPQLHSFDLRMNGQFLERVQFTGFGLELGEYLNLREHKTSLQAEGVLISGNNRFTIDYTAALAEGQAHVDWVEFIYTARLAAVDNALIFTVFPDSGLKNYRIRNFSSSNVRLFDVTDFANVREITDFSFSNGALTFSAVQDGEQPGRYLALDPSQIKSVESSLERVEVTDLRAPGLGAEFLIITHADFHSEALRLESLRENGNPDNRLQTHVVRISDVYANFSGGLLDPVAIRDFLKYAYENWSPRPTYVLLFGDGDYDPRNILSTGDKNWIPTFQTTELAELRSRTTDSWYTYVSGNDTFMDMAIGRINAQTPTDARRAVDKIIAYETDPLRGVWRKTVTMVGDDELVGDGRPSAIDANLHIPQSERIVRMSVPNYLDVEKIYLTEFPKVLSASVSGVTKPAAREALIRQINKGTLIVNYIGHGNATQWAHEVVFHKSDNERVENFDKLIFFIAATCDWALYDNPQSQSQAEQMLLAENRGAIAILSSGRLVFSGQNARYNEVFYGKLFPEFGKPARIGDAFVASRLVTNSITNDEKFHIFGDPTLRLAVPRERAVVTSMTPDSIVALQTMEISGEVLRDGQVWSDFQGKAFIKTMDSKRLVEHIPEAGGPNRYTLPGNSIYRGAVPVENGRFAAKFIVPKDLSYGGNQARVSLYVWNEDTDGMGHEDNIVVSGSTAELTDTHGPEMNVYFKGQEHFVTGDVVDENPTLVVEVADTVSGVNIAGEIGHQMTLTVDPEEETCLSRLNRFLGLEKIDLTEFFQFNEGDHLRGKVELPMRFPRDVEIAGERVSCVDEHGEQRHTLVVKAWDNANNSTTASVQVRVIHGDGLAVRDVVNYPNPFARETTFSFFLNRDAEVQIKIYTLSGLLIRTLEHPFGRTGFNMVEWDGRDAQGDALANGVYLYKLVARVPGVSNGIEQREVVGKVAIVR